jgi:hypothetical protein
MHHLTADTAPEMQRCDWIPAAITDRRDPPIGARFRYPILDARCSISILNTQYPGLRGREFERSQTRACPTGCWATVGSIRRLRCMARNSGHIRGERGNYFNRRDADTRYATRSVISVAVNVDINPFGIGEIRDALWTSTSDFGISTTLEASSGSVAIRNVGDR